MSVVGWLLLVLSSAAAAHPGHDAPEPHFHALWELAVSVLIAGAVVVAFALRRRGRGRCNVARRNG